MSLLNFDGNVSYYVIPAQFGLNMLCHWTRIALVSKSVSWNNASPRSNEARAAAGLTKAQNEMVARTANCHNNGLEFLSLLSAAIISGNVTGVPQAVLNKWSIIILLCRVAYVPLYIFGTSQLIALARTLTWVTATGSSAYLLKLAADAAYAK